MKSFPPVKFSVRVLVTLLVAMTVALVRGELQFEKTAIEETVSPGTENVDFAFPFKNAGEQPVEITSVKTSCGCTTAKLDKKVYLPGEEGEITGTFNLGSRQGFQKKTVTVHTSDLGQSEIKLGIRVDIPQLLSLKPGLLLWRQGSEPEPKSIFVDTNETLGIQITSVESASEGFSVELVSDEAGVLDKTQKHTREILVSPKDTATPERALIKIAASDGNGFERTYFAHALVK